jgi:hypothetical protein
MVANSRLSYHLAYVGSHLACFVFVVCFLPLLSIDDLLVLLRCWQEKVCQTVAESVHQLAANCYW